jgi:hypothetical protein
LQQSPSPEKQRRLSVLIEALAGEPIHGEPLREERAIQVLETLASPESRGLLVRLSHGESSASQARKAQAALARLGKQRQASEVTGSSRRGLDSELRQRDRAGLAADAAPGGRASAGEATTRGGGGCPGEVSPLRGGRGTASVEGGKAEGGEDGLSPGMSLTGRCRVDLIARTGSPIQTVHLPGGSAFILRREPLWYRKVVLRLTLCVAVGLCVLQGVRSVCAVRQRPIEERIDEAWLQCRALEGREDALGCIYPHPKEVFAQVRRDYRAARAKCEALMDERAREWNSQPVWRREIRRRTGW